MSMFSTANLSTFPEKAHDLGAEIDQITAGVCPATLTLGESAEHVMKQADAGAALDEAIFRKARKRNAEIPVAQMEVEDAESKRLQCGTNCVHAQVALNNSIIKCENELKHLIEARSIADSNAKELESAQQKVEPLAASAQYAYEQADKLTVAHNKAKDAEGQATAKAADLEAAHHSDQMAKSTAKAAMDSARSNLELAQGKELAANEANHHASETHRKLRQTAYFSHISSTQSKLQAVYASKTSAATGDDPFGGPFHEHVQGLAEAAENKETEAGTAAKDAASKMRAAEQEKKNAVRACNQATDEHDTKCDEYRSSAKKAFETAAQLQQAQEAKHAASNALLCAQHAAERAKATKDHQEQQLSKGKACVTVLTETQKKNVDRAEQAGVEVQKAMQTLSDARAEFVQRRKLFSESLSRELKARLHASNTSKENSMVEKCATSPGMMSPSEADFLIKRSEEVEKHARELCSGLRGPEACHLAYGM